MAEFSKASNSASVAGGLILPLIESELYFLIARFLGTGPCRKAAEVLVQELEQYQLLPKRLDWEGKEHYSSYQDLILSNKHVAPDHLLQICKRIGSILDKEIPPSIPGVNSLLGAGKQSLLRTKDFRYTNWKGSGIAALHRGRPPEISINYDRKPTLVELNYARQLTGCVQYSCSFPENMYQHIKMHRRILGHLSAVYCVAFDRTGHRIFTGSDDGLVKIWCTHNGRLLASLRGHSAEIADMAVNLENTMIAAGSCDKIIRVWCLRTCAPIAVLQNHTGSITSLQFSPLVKDSTRYMASTGADGTVCIWQWDIITMKFNNRPWKFIEKLRPGVQILCSSFSVGGMFLATGSTDNIIRIYYFGFEIAEKIAELKNHADTVDSIQFSNRDDRFISGSKDGTARIWRFQQAEWKNILLDMADKLPSDLCSEADKFMKPKVTMVAWSQNDNVVVTAVSNYLLKVWNSYSGQLLYDLQGHADEVFVLEPHPFDSRVMLSAGHDGNIFIWDIEKGIQMKHYFNVIQGQGHGAVFDCKFSSDGQHFTCTDSHGHLLIFGFGCNKAYEKIPDHMFFHTDYRPLIRDANNYVLDEQTQQAPHLMPPPFLVDIYGNPHPTKYQRLVPGRENCSDDHLIPQLGYIATIDGEIIEQVMGEQIVEQDEENLEPDILDGDLQQFQDQRIDIDQDIVSANPHYGRETPPGDFHRLSSDIESSPNIGLRRSGEVEGVPQMHQNSPRSQIATKRDRQAWNQRIVVPDIIPSIFRNQEEYRSSKGEEEKWLYTIEQKRKLLQFSEKNDSEDSLMLFKRMWPECASYQSQNNIEQSDSSNEDIGDCFEFIDQEAEESNGLSLTSREEEWKSDQKSDSNSSSESSSQYSDWIADAGMNLHPPVRMSQRKISTDYISSEDEETIEKDFPPKIRRKRKKKYKPEKHESTDETSLSKYKAPNWIINVKLQRSPFVPQMGDEVIYFRQGHEAYIEAVRKNDIYELNPHKVPWRKMMLRDQELVKIVGIHYQVGPPTLCCLKLTLMDNVTRQLQDESFCLKYHDMPGVIDFLVLHQFYREAVQRSWQPYDQFRSIIDEQWWFGTVLSQEPYQSQYPDSPFQCYSVKWDNGETERLSPWDMEPISDSAVLPPDLGASVGVTSEEMERLLYKPQKGEWQGNSQMEESERILSGIDQLMELDISAPIANEVHFSTYASYCKVIAYPTHLWAIQLRLMHRFYRRLSALIWEVRCIGSNALTFYGPHSKIAKTAQKITDQLLEFIRNPNCTNIFELCTASNEDSFAATESDGDYKPRTSSRTRQSLKGKNITKSRYDENIWKKQCMELINLIFQCEDSKPFRQPVDLDQYLAYKEFNDDIPMDLATVKETLEAENYDTPMELCNDMRSIFNTIKENIPNKRSKIYGMSLTLSALFEEKITRIISDFSNGQSLNKSVQYPAQIVRNAKQKHCKSQTEIQSETENSSDENTSGKTSCVTSDVEDTTSCTHNIAELSSDSAPYFESNTWTRNTAVTHRLTAESELEHSSTASSSSLSSSEESKESSTALSSPVLHNGTSGGKQITRKSELEHSSTASSLTSSEESSESSTALSSPVLHNGTSGETSILRITRNKIYRQKQTASQRNADKKRTARKRIWKRKVHNSNKHYETLNNRFGRYKKIPRRSATVAANKLRMMNDVEEEFSSSDSGGTQSRNRKLPHRNAAAAARKLLLNDSEEESSMHSESDKELEEQSDRRKTPSSESESGNSNSESGMKKIPNRYPKKHLRTACRASSKMKHSSECSEDDSKNHVSDESVQKRVHQLSSSYKINANSSSETDLEEECKVLPRRTFTRASFRSRKAKILSDSEEVESGRDDETPCSSKIRIFSKISKHGQDDSSNLESGTDSSHSRKCPGRKDSVVKENGLSKSTRKRPFQSDCQAGACKSEYIYGKFPLMTDEENFASSDSNKKLNCHSIASATRKQLDSSTDGSQQSGEAKRIRYCRRKYIQSSTAAKIDCSDSENSSNSESAERKKLHFEKAHRRKPKTAYNKSINPILEKSLKSQLPNDRNPDNPVYDSEGDSELDQCSDSIKEKHLCQMTVDFSGKSINESEIQHKENGTDSLPNSKNSYKINANNSSDSEQECIPRHTFTRASRKAKILSDSEEVESGRDDETPSKIRIFSKISKHGQDDSSQNTKSKTRADSSCASDLEIESYCNATKYSDVKTQLKKKKEKTDDIKEESASQLLNQHPIVLRKRNTYESCIEFNDMSMNIKTYNGKKIPRQSAAVAASKIKLISDAKEEFSSPEVGYCRKKNRILPPRNASIAARKILDDLLSLSDSETELNGHKIKGRDDQDCSYSSRQSNTALNHNWSDDQDCSDSPRQSNTALNHNWSDDQDCSDSPRQSNTALNHNWRDDQDCSNSPRQSNTALKATYSDAEEENVLKQRSSHSSGSRQVAMKSVCKKITEKHFDEEFSTSITSEEQKSSSQENVTSNSSTDSELEKKCNFTNVRDTGHNREREEMEQSSALSKYEQVGISEKPKFEPYSSESDVQLECKPINNNGGVKTTKRKREASKILQSRKRSKVNEEESDSDELHYTKYKKINRRSKIRTRNRGRQTVSYADDDDCET
ncbi:bromodomain and WD repeat-containing protein 1 isoform X2 [Erythrolamprus reginae]|uniref:bromodomain and WD repeat-containing protein 1 isoform X2 n=1 Tax=Erythrolamprus reginae TaxID=121349 RepID=UPI00396CCA6D